MVPSRTGSPAATRAMLSRDIPRSRATAATDVALTRAAMTASDSDVASDMPRAWARPRDRGSKRDLLTPDYRGSLAISFLIDVGDRCTPKHVFHVAAIAGHRPPAVRPSAPH